MVITIIEKVYSFLWGDLITLPLPGGGTLGISFNPIIDPNRHLFYDPYKISTDPFIS